jgi:hypothetical protein
METCLSDHFFKSHFEAIDWHCRRYDEALEKETYQPYYKNVLSVLYKMKPGEQIEVRAWCKPENYELFIKTVCACIAGFEVLQQTVFFSQNGEIIKKIETPIEVLNELYNPKNLKS